MSRIAAGTSILIALFSFMAICPLVSAQTAVIPFTDRGWYPPTGLHDPFILNYIVGDWRTSFGNNDSRNFFVFDLSTVTQPIATAKLALFVPGPSPPGFFSGDGSENYELHDVSTPIATLLNGTGGVAAHTDLGSGVVYGSRTMTAADMGSVVEISLNAAAISALDAATGLIGFGGSITTLDGLANDEYVFGWTNGWLTNQIETTQLRLTLVPEPSSVVLCLAATFATLMRRRRPRS
jgi:hypothetical protein